jgi:hypothetical protein
MTDRQMKNGAAEFDAVTQQTCRPCSRRRYDANESPKSPKSGREASPNRRHEEGFSRYAGTAQRSARQSVADSHKGRWKGNPAAAFGFDSVLGCVRIRMRSRFNESLPRQWLGRGDLRSR